MSDEDIDRIIKMRLSPVHISVHTTNPALRVEMMKNPRAGEVLSYLPRLAEAGITVCAQIVLCRGVNDGEELLRTMHDLAALYPALDSVSVVPAGLTKFRDGLYPLSPFTPDECLAVIRTVEDFAAKCKASLGAYLFHASDEFYLKAGAPLPDEARYEGYPQLDNGVGMLTSFETDFMCALDNAPALASERRVSIATGRAAYPLLSSLVARVKEREPRLNAQVYLIENDFFGPEITVAGLLTGKDYFAALAGKTLGDALLISRTSLRAEGDLFLCGMSKDELSEKLSVPVVAVENDGEAFLHALLATKGEN